MHIPTLRPAALAALLLLAAATLAGCETTGSGPAPQAAAAPVEPMTHQQASLECWMSTEKEAARMSLDKRADVVDACIERKMKGEPASTAAAKPDAGPKAGASPGPKPKT